MAQRWPSNGPNAPRYTVRSEQECHDEHGPGLESTIQTPALTPETRVQAQLAGEHTGKAGGQRPSPLNTKQAGRDPPSLGPVPYPTASVSAVNRRTRGIRCSPTSKNPQVGGTGHLSL